MAIETQISAVNVSTASYAGRTTVVGQPDIPGLSTSAMQESVEYMPRNLLAPKINELVKAVNESYSKAETDGAIDAKVTEIGAGDMAKTEYDPAVGGVNPVRQAGGIPAYVTAQMAWANNLKSVQLTLTAAGWSDTAPFTQTVSNAAITNGDYTLDGLVAGNSETADAWDTKKEAYACISYGTTVTGTATFVCLSDKPVTDITIRIRGAVVANG